MMIEIVKHIENIVSLQAKKHFFDISLRMKHVIVEHWIDETIARPQSLNQRLEPLDESLPSGVFEITREETLYIVWQSSPLARNVNKVLPIDQEMKGFRREIASLAILEGNVDIVVLSQRPRSI